MKLRRAQLALVPFSSERDLLVSMCPEIAFSYAHFHVFRGVGACPGRSRDTMAVSEIAPVLTIQSVTLTVSKLRVCKCSGVIVRVPARFTPAGTPPERHVASWAERVGGRTWRILRCGEFARLATRSSTHLLEILPWCIPTWADSGIFRKCRDLSARLAAACDSLVLVSCTRRGH